MMTPQDWQQFVRLCRVKELSEVYNMTLDNMKHAKALFDNSDTSLIYKKNKTEKFNKEKKR